MVTDIFIIGLITISSIYIIDHIEGNIRMIRKKTFNLKRNKMKTMPSSIFYAI